MTDSAVIHIALMAIMTTTKLAAPILIVSLAVGLGVSLVQSVTQIQEFTLTFKDAAGQPMNVSAAALTFHMPAMGTMAAMNETATLTTTSTPGVYHGKARIEMAGEWQAQISYEGPAGRGQGPLDDAANLLQQPRGGEQVMRFD